MENENNHPVVVSNLPSVAGNIERFKPYGNEAPEKIHQLNFTLELVNQDLPAKDIALITEAHTKSMIDILEAENKIAIANSNDMNKKLAFVISSASLFAPLIPGLELVFAYGIASIGGVGFATALYSFFGEKAFEAGKEFRKIFRFSSEEESMNE